MEACSLPKRTKVANKKEVAAFWTTVMRGAPMADGNLPDMKDQLKASEHLGKHHGMFKESKESPGQVKFVGNDHVAD